MNNVINTKPIKTIEELNAIRAYESISKRNLLKLMGLSIFWILLGLLQIFLGVLGLASALIDIGCGCELIALIFAYFVIDTAIETINITDDVNVSVVSVKILEKDRKKNIIKFFDTDREMILKVPGKEILKSPDDTMHVLKVEKDNGIKYFYMKNLTV